MNVLPWLLDWPPSRFRVGFFLFVTLFSVGTLAVFGGITDETAGENVTIESTDVTVRLNDETSYPDDATESVQTCLASGTPGDSISVLGDVVVAVPPERDRESDAEGDLTIVVSLAHTDETTTERIEASGTETMDVFWILEDDETLAVGDTAQLQVRVRTETSTVSSVTRLVPVRNGTRSFDC